MLNLNEEIEPVDLAFENHKIGIVYTSSKEFAKYTAASILSIAKNSSDQDKYDVIILEYHIIKQNFFAITINWSENDQFLFLWHSSNTLL